MNKEQFRQAAYECVDRICDYFDSLDSRPVIPDVAPGEVGSKIAERAPEKGHAWPDIAKDFDDVILPGIAHWQSPNFFAYFPANTTYESILADMLVGAVSNPGFNWACSPSCTELEVRVMDWVAKLLGLDQSFHNASNVGGGVIQGSASEAALTAAVAARARIMRMKPDVKAEDLVLYGTTQTHSLGAKTALILGLKFKAIETRAEHNWSLKGDDLRRVLEEDVGAGLQPFCLFATLGSTSTGTIDAFDEITLVARDFPTLFIHVDAAWAGVFLALPELRMPCKLDAINARASAAAASEAAICPAGEIHSFCTNLHKSGLVTFDASCLWIRDRRLLTEALDITPPFLRNKHSDTGLVVDYRNWQLPLGRRFRSLKVYFVLRSYGVEGFQQHLRHLIDMAVYLESLVATSDTIELFTPRSLSLLVIRLRGTDSDHEERLNREFFRRINEIHDIHLTPTVVGGRYCTRIAIGSPRTQKLHIDTAWALIQRIEKETRSDLTNT